MEQSSGLGCICIEEKKYQFPLPFFFPFKSSARVILQKQIDRTRNKGSSKFLLRIISFTLYGAFIHIQTFISKLHFKSVFEIIIITVESIMRGSTLAIKHIQGNEMRMTKIYGHYSVKNF